MRREGRVVLDEAGLEAGGAAEGAERDEGISAPAPSEPRSPLPPAAVVVDACSGGAVVAPVVAGAPIDEVGSFPSALAFGPVPVPASTSADLAPELVSRRVAESATPPMPEPDVVRTPGADGRSTELEGNDWMVTFAPFGSGVVGVVLLAVESEPGPETGAEVGVGAAVGPESTVGAAAGAVVADRAE